MEKVCHIKDIEVFLKNLRTILEKHGVSWTRPKISEESNVSEITGIKVLVLEVLGEA